MMKIIIAIALAALLSGCMVVLVKAPVDSLYHHEQRADKMDINQRVQAIDDVGVNP